MRYWDRLGRLICTALNGKVCLLGILLLADWELQRRQVTGCIRTGHRNLMTVVESWQLCRLKFCAEYLAEYLAEYRLDSVILCHVLEWFKHAGRKLLQLNEPATQQLACNLELVRDCAPG